MLLQHGSSEYPSLAEYLNVAKRAPSWQAWPYLLLAVVVTVFGLLFAPALAESAIGGRVYLLFALGCWAAVYIKRPQPPSSQEASRIEAAEAAAHMSLCLERARLHRDLGQPVMAVLEDCARHWAEVHHAMDSTFWRSEQLPSHYRSIRSQVLSAADRAMDETILLFRNVLPENPRSPDVKGFLGEIIQETVFGGVKPSAHLPAGFDQARAMADKLRDLAAHVSAVTREAAEELGPRVEVDASAALDLCIGELKILRQAESELRQGVEG